MKRPKGLDLFCGAGGCSKGYDEADFDMTGVDLYPQRHYPYQFVQADWAEYLAEHWREYDFIHASPPCQGYSQLAAMHPMKAATYPKLIEPVRQALRTTGLPYAIENVESAPLSGVVLCGSMFDLRVERGWLRRHRRFETSFSVVQPKCVHGPGPAVGVYGHGGHSGKHRMLKRDEAAEIMRIDWMNRDELAQAIPPAYTRFIGVQLREALGLAILTNGSN
jgi:DNA (cytosine-5)-methyltransferase 1